MTTTVENLPNGLEKRINRHRCETFRNALREELFRQAKPEDFERMQLFCDRQEIHFLERLRGDETLVKCEGLKVLTCDYLKLGMPKSAAQMASELKAAVKQLFVNAKLAEKQLEETAERIDQETADFKAAEEAAIAEALKNDPIWRIERIEKHLGIELD